MKWIFILKSSSCNCIHYVADFFVVCSSKVDCESSLKFMTRRCRVLRASLAEYKTEVLQQTQTFFGVGIDSIKQLFVPDSKQKDILVEFTLFDRRQRASKRQIFSPVGKLITIIRCIPAGRIFLQRMLDLAHRVNCIEYVLQLNQEIKADLGWWK